MAKAAKLKASLKRLYIGGQSEKVNCNLFNFVSTPWADLYVAIATIKPEKLKEEDFAADDELNFLMFMVHSLSKSYVVYESMDSIRANLEWSSWYLSKILETYESKYCWLQKLFSDLTRGLDQVENKMRELVWPLTRIKNAPDVIASIQRQYGGDFLGVNIGGLLQSLVTNVLINS